MHRPFLVATVVSLSLLNNSTLSDAKSKPCFVFDEEQPVTVRGQFKKSATLEVGEGEPPHKIMEMKLDYPICFLNNSSDRINIIEVFPFAPKWLGHRVIVTGTMTAGPSWGIKINKIKDAPR